MLLSLILATSYAPSAANKVQVSTGVSAAQWVSLPNCIADGGNALNFNTLDGGFTCGSVAGTATTPGGSTTQVQYNNGGAFGGVSKVESDGTNARLVGQSTHASAPAVGKNTLYGWSFDAGYQSPILPMYMDGYLGLATPVGLFRDFGANSSASWQTSCCTPVGYSGATTPVCSNLSGTAAVAVAGSASSPAWAVTDLYTRSRVVQMVTASNAANLNAGALIQTSLQFYRGGAAGAGGFVYWTRVKLVGVTTDQRAFFGLISRTSVLTASANPSSFADTIYIGGDDGDGNLSICSNDNVDVATCESLGASFPSTTAGAIYDIWFSAAPNASSIEYAIVRLDSAAMAAGSVTSNLPRNTVQLAWQSLLNTGAAGGGSTVTLGWMGACMAYNY